MSSYEIRQDIYDLKEKMSKDSTLLSNDTLSAIAKLLETYGEFLGQALANLPTYKSSLIDTDNVVRSYLQALPRFYDRVDAGIPSDRAHPIIGLGVQKIMETVSFVETLTKNPPKDTVPKEMYDKLVDENEKLNYTVKVMMRGGTFPRLNDLIEEIKKVGMGIDENWVLSLCALNLLEAGVNKKLEDLTESTEGDFIKRLDRLKNIIKERENKDIQQILPESLYKGARQRLDHASHKYKPNPTETNSIVKSVLDFLKEIFPEINRIFLDGSL